MKAAVLHEIGKPLIVEDVQLDPPKSHEVRVKIAAAGVCRSDLHFMKGHALIPIPAVLGHEGSAIVEQVGEGVDSVQPGDHVILSFVPYCGHCYSCLSGRPNLCDKHLATGAKLFDGTSRLHVNGQDVAHMGKVACFAEEAVVPETGCIPIGHHIPMDVAALIGCSVTTGVGSALFSSDILPGDTVVVIGCGGVGLNVIQGARLLNASKIIAVDINDAALEFASRFGATDAINPMHGDPLKKIKELTDGQGAHHTFEVYGSSETAKLAFDAARKRGTVVMVGIAPVGETAPIDMVSLVRQEKSFKGSYYGSSRPSLDMHQIVSLYESGNLDIDSLVTRHYTLDQINEAYESLDQGVVGRGVIMLP